MRLWLLLITLGAVAVLAPPAAYFYHRSVQARDLEDVAALRAALDSLRASLDAASATADSAQLLSTIRAREEGLGRREYHIVHNGAHLDAWWRPTGTGTLVVGAGVVMMTSGLVLRHRRRLGAG
jgi:hypothetical protein